MTYKITKSFRFEAAHRLDHLSADHKCYRLHGHNYEVILELGMLGPLVPIRGGMVVDYGELSATFGEYLKEEVDHRYIVPDHIPGDAFAFQQYVLEDQDFTTAECIASHFAAVIQKRYVWSWALNSVTVKETPDTSATFVVGNRWKYETN